MRLLVAGLMIIAAAFLATTVVRIFIYNPSIEAQPSAALAAISAKTPASLHPERVVIPALSINAKTEDLGVIAGSRMAAPKHYDTVGWYKYGPAPGAAGLAVMYGHLDNGLGLEGVFKNLNELKVGQEIEVVTAGGETPHFKVTKIETYAYNAIPDSALHNAQGDSSPRLLLITCAGQGINDPAIGFTYDKRLLVYATLTM